MIRKILKVLLFLVVLLLIGGWFFIRNNRPVYKGNLQIPELRSGVEVYFDKIGVPHIYAEDQYDAYVALGYVHAQDRLWQMELLRRIAPGRLSEIFGEKLIKVDKFFKGLGIDVASKREVARLDTTSQSFKLAQAYLKGVNRFVDDGATPVEFRLIGIDKVHYTLNDIYNVFGYMSFGFAMAHKTDPFLSDLKDQLGMKYLRELDIQQDPKTTEIKSYSRKSRKRGKHITGNISSAVNEIMKNAKVPPLIGSNSWVIGSKRTKNKKVIFANDPHIGFAQPAVWYQSHIVTPDFEIYGFNLGLTPYPLLGHNRKYAYGLTMFENDDIDFYREPENATYKTRKETIKVLDGDDVTFEVRVGKHGQVMNDFIDAITGDNLVTMDWIYTRPELKNEMLDVSYRISHARSLQDFKKGASKIHAPGLNVMYGDAKNNIAWFATGKLYFHKNNVNTKFILDGGNGSDDQIRFLDFSKNPQAINPPWNYVYSANNQPSPIDGKLYPGYYIPEDRAKRIVQLIEPKKDFDFGDVKKMITDDQSSVVPGLVKIILNEVSVVNLSENEKEAMQILKDWKGNYRKDLVGPTIYNRFIYRFLYNTFADEMGDDFFDQFMDTGLVHRQIAKQIKMYKSVWWDDIRTKDIKENREEIFTRSFHEAITALEEQLGDDVEDWTFNRVLSVTHNHAFNEVASLKSIFNVGPFETNGGNEVINNQIFPISKSGVYEVKAGPSTRRIVDFSNVENSVAILPTGQSGNVFSKHYKDQAETYLQGGFFKMIINKGDIHLLDDKLVLEPVEKH